MAHFVKNCGVTCAAIFVRLNMIEGYATFWSIQKNGYIQKRTLTPFFNTINLQFHFKVTSEFVK
ncbi:MAG: hypothetical protein DRR19_07500 [Candidatus Parabeggiatoa sp. nov. 1]|nr:MAG: hypothetical protein DRR19_07500 [Gammaproteobacteria bacterium]